MSHIGKGKMAKRSFAKLVLYCGIGLLITITLCWTAHLRAEPRGRRFGWAFWQDSHSASEVQLAVRGNAVSVARHWADRDIWMIWEGLDAAPGTVFTASSPPGNPSDFPHAYTSWGELGATIDLLDDNPYQPQLRARPPGVHGFEYAYGWPWLALSLTTVVDERRVWHESGAIQLGVLNSVWPSSWRDTLPIRPVWPGFLLDTLFWAGSVWITVHACKLVRRCSRYRRGRCPRCAYDLAHDYRDGCPECGWRRDKAPAAAS